jgi:hypothetical protein
MQSGHRSSGRRNNRSPTPTGTGRACAPPARTEDAGAGQVDHHVNPDRSRQLVHRFDATHAAVEDPRRLFRLPGQDDHRVAVAQKRAHQVLADESCGAGDEHGPAGVVEGDGRRAIAALSHPPRPQRGKHIPDP